MSPRILPGALLAGLLLSVPARAQIDYTPARSGINTVQYGEFVARLPGGPAGEGYALHQEEPDLGSHVYRRVVTGSPLPFDKTWAELTARQKDLVRARYQNIPANEDPPYPADGLYGVYRPVSNVLEAYAQRGRGVTLGALRLGVIVAPDGTPDSVTVYDAPDLEVARRIGEELLGVRFKPGMCGGTPCQMEFPVELDVSRRM